MLKFVSSIGQVTDLFTKALGVNRFLELGKKIKMCECMNLDFCKDVNN